MSLKVLIESFYAGLQTAVEEGKFSSSWTKINYLEMFIPLAHYPYLVQRGRHY